MVAQDITFNYKVLGWARSQAKLGLEDAAKRAKINQLKQRGRREAITPQLRLENWENNRGSPSYSQLLSLAKAYRRPLLTFFLPKPPTEEIQLLDFRTTVDNDHEIQAHQVEFSALVRQVKATQKAVRELLQDTKRSPLRFVGTITLEADPTQVARSIQQTLDCNLLSQKKAKSPDEVFALVRKKAEDKGIYVMVQGNLGSYHTDMSRDVFQGFTISDQIAPFIVINPNDTKTARLFTILHELCHLWLGQTGVSNWNSLNLRLPKPNNPAELFCDQVAAEFLVPKNDLLKRWELLRIGYEPDVVIKRIAREFNVSPIVIARRLLESKQISTDDYWSWYENYQIEWQRIKELLKKKKEENPKSFVPHVLQTKNKLGKALISTVINATREGTISDLDASLILDVKVNNFAKII